MPRIKVETTWGGGNNYGFCLTTSKGDRENLRGWKWDRKLASKALDLFEQVYGYKRSTIRFEVK